MLQVLKLCFLVLFSCIASAQSWDWELPEKERLPIRKNILNPDTLFFVPQDQDGRTSNGIPFEVKNLHQVEQELRLRIEAVGYENFQDTRFYLTGVAMRDERRVKSQYEKMLHRLKLDERGVDVVIFSVPTVLVHQQVRRTWETFFEQVRYFFPSMQRDFESPTKFESFFASSITTLSNIPNLFFILPKKINPHNYLLTATAHLSLNLSTSIFFRFLGNWGNRYQSSSSRGRFFERYGKQALVTAIFVISYNVFGNFHEISQYFGSAHDFVEASKDVGWESLKFLQKNLVTIALNVLYYAQINTNGFAHWASSKKGVVENRMAQTILPWIRIPTSALQTGLLALSSTAASTPWLDLGLVQINEWHLPFAAAVGVGTFVFWKWPNFLDSVLELAFRLRDFGRYLNHPNPHGIIYVQEDASLSRVSRPRDRPISRCADF
ncbi:MAG: hypothetical protein WCH11_03820 [Bdellovibrio sp.]